MLLIIEYFIYMLKTMQKDSCGRRIEWNKIEEFLKNNHLEN